MAVNDTCLEAEAVQLQLLRNATTSQRFNLMNRLTSIAIRHSKRAIARANPNASQRELDLIFVEVHYGKHLADEMRRYLEKQRG